MGERKNARPKGALNERADWNNLRARRVAARRRRAAPGAHLPVSYTHLDVYKRQGLLGVVWIKLLLPFMLRLVNFIPWNWRYMLTTVAACFMLVDAVMTLQALDCWYMRLSHDPVDTPLQQFYDHEFGDAYMADRFQSMTIVPSDAVRG